MYALGGSCTRYTAATLAGSPRRGRGCGTRSGCLRCQTGGSVSLSSIGHTFPHTYSLLQCLGQKFQLRKVLRTRCTRWIWVLFLGFWSWRRGPGWFPDLQQPPGNAQTPLQLSLLIGAGVQGALQLRYQPEDRCYVSLGTPRQSAPFPSVALDPPVHAVCG